MVTAEEVETTETETVTETEIVTASGEEIVAETIEEDNLGVVVTTLETMKDVILALRAITDE